MPRKSLIAIILGLAANTALATLVIKIYGYDRAGLEMALAATARLSFLIWVIAFAASSLRILIGSDWTKDLLRNRRQIGIAFACAHAVHGLLVIRWLDFIPGGISFLGLAPGGFVYLVIIAMFATSFDTTVKMIGAKAWRILHKSGMWLLAAVFLFAFGAGSLTWEQAPTHAPFFLIALLAVALRTAAWRKKRAAKRAA